MALRILALATIVSLAGCAHRCCENCMQHANPGSSNVQTTTFEEEDETYLSSTDDSSYTTQVSYTEPIETLSNADLPAGITYPAERLVEQAAESSFDHDRAFVKEAAMVNLTEIELGKEALKSAASEDVRRFGQRMIDDHSKAQSDLKAAAGSSFEVPDELDAEHRGMVDRHARLSGREFHRAYMEMMVSNHPKVIDKFERASDSAKDRSLRDFARRTLPALREHLSQARDTQARLESDRSR